MCFGLMGSHNQLSTFHTLINLLVTNLFHIHAQPQTSKAARQDKNGVLQSVPWSAGRLLSQWHDISTMWNSKPANQTQSEASKCVPEQFFTGRKLQSFGVLENCIWPANKPLQKDLKLCEALWRLCEVILRTGFRTALLDKNLHFKILLN